MKAKTQGAAKIATRADWLRQWMPIALILLLATVLYLYQLGTESLWVDELFSIYDARTLERDRISVRPLYYILLRVWMQFGTSDTWLRGLSILFALGSVLLTYQLGRRLAGKTTGLIAALLLVLSPLFINHAQEVRMYALSTFLGLGGTLALTNALDHPTTSSMLLWAGARLLAILTTPLNFLLLLPDIVLSGWRFCHQRRVLLAFGKWLLLICILWLPFAFSLAKATPEFAGGWIAEFPRPSVLDVVHLLTKFTRGSFDSPLDAIAWFYKQFFKLYAVMWMWLLGVALLNKQHPRLIWVATWMFLPSVTLFLISQISVNLWVERYLLVLCPYFLILLAVGFTQIWHWRRTVAIVVALVYIVGVGVGLTNYYTVQNREDWRALVQTISINEEPGDTIGLFSDSYPIARALDHYYHGFAPINIIEDSALRLNPKFDKSFMERAVHSWSPIKSRLWLIYQHPINKEQHQIFQTVVREQFIVKENWTFKGLDLFILREARG